MERKYNARLVPIERAFNSTEINDIIKLLKTSPDGELGAIIISKNKMFGNDYWQPQRLVITSDERRSWKRIKKISKKKFGGELLSCRLILNNKVCLGLRCLSQAFYLARLLLYLMSMGVWCNG